MQTWDEHVENHERFLRALIKAAEFVDVECELSVDEDLEKDTATGSRTPDLSGLSGLLDA
jgi:hypothetical protein